MPSIKPKIQGYVESELFSAFEQWRIEQNKGISEALNDLLKEFFKFERFSYKEGLNKEEIEKLIEEKLFAINRRIESLEEIVEPIIGLAEISHPLPESVGDSLQSPEEEEREWAIGDRVRVLCKSSYEGRLGTIIDFDQCLGWHVAVDRWWEAVGISESVIDEWRRRTGNIWCGPKEMELLEEESKPSSLEGEDLEAPPVTPEQEEESKGDSDQSQAQENNPLTIPPQSPYYSAENYPRKGDKLRTSHGKEGEVIKLWSQNPEYEVRWRGSDRGKRYDLADLRAMEARRIPSPIPLEGLKQSDLERRLKISKGILTKRRDRADFKEWSQSHDPQGIAWQWDAIARKYLAVE